MLENEAHIIDQAQQGNAEYFGLLYDHYVGPIYRFVFLKTNNKAEAEDLVHETFLSAWKNIDDFDYEGYPFSSWLYRIARNKVIDHYRTKKALVTLEAFHEEIFKITDPIENTLDLKLSLNQIKAALPLLKEDQRSVLIMRFVEDLSYREIAGVLEKNEGAIRLIQHRAIQNLKRIIHYQEKNHGQFI